MAAKTSGASPDKRRKYDEAFKAEALRLASKSRSTQAAVALLAEAADVFRLVGRKRAGGGSHS